MKNLLVIVLFGLLIFASGSESSNIEGSPEPTRSEVKQCSGINKACGGDEHNSAPLDCCKEFYCSLQFGFCKAKKELNEGCNDPRECKSGHCDVELNKGKLCKEKSVECNPPGEACKKNGLDCCAGSKCEQGVCNDCQEIGKACSVASDCCSENCFYDEIGVHRVCRVKEENCLKDNANCKDDGSQIKRTCCSGFYCKDARTCTSAKAIGATCEFSYECLSGVCKLNPKGRKDTICAEKSKSTTVTPNSLKIEGDKCSMQEQILKKVCEEGLVCYESTCVKSCKIDGEACTEENEAVCCSGKCIFKAGIGHSTAEMKCGKESDHQSEFGRCEYLKGGIEPKCKNGLFCIASDGVKKCTRRKPNSQECSHENECSSDHCFWNSAGTALICQDTSVKTIPNGGSCEKSHSPIPKTCASKKCCDGQCSDKLEDGDPCNGDDECCSKRCDFNLYGKKLCLGKKEKNCVSSTPEVCESIVENGQAFPKCCEGLTCYEHSCKFCKPDGYERCTKDSDCCSNNCFWKDDGSMRECAPKEKRELKEGAICPETPEICEGHLKCYKRKCTKCQFKDGQFCDNDGQCCSKKCVFNAEGKKICGYGHAKVTKYGGACELEAFGQEYLPVCDPNSKLFCVDYRCINCIYDSQEECSGGDKCCSKICGYHDSGSYKACKNKGDQMCIREGGLCDKDSKDIGDFTQTRICCDGICYGSKSKICKRNCLADDAVLEEGKACCSGISGYMKGERRVCLAQKKIFQEIDEICDVEGPAFPPCNKGLSCIKSETQNFGFCKKCFGIGVKGCLIDSECCEGKCDLKTNMCVKNLETPQVAKPEMKQEAKTSSDPGNNCIESNGVCENDDTVRCCAGFACGDSNKCEECSNENEKCDSQPCCSNLKCSPSLVCEKLDCSQESISCKSIYDCCEDSICDLKNTGNCIKKPGTPCRTSGSPCKDKECCEGHFCFKANEEEEEGICKVSERQKMMLKKKKLLFAEALKKKKMMERKKKIFKAMAVNEDEKADGGTKEEAASGEEKKNTSPEKETTEASATQETPLETPEIDQTPIIDNFLYEVELIKEYLLKSPSAKTPKPCIARQKKCKVNLPSENAMLMQLGNLYKRYIEYEKSGKSPKGIPPSQIPPLKDETLYGLNYKIPVQNGQRSTGSQNEMRFRRSRTRETYYNGELTDVGLGVFIPKPISTVFELISKSRLDQYRKKLSKYIDFDALEAQEEKNAQTPARNPENDWYLEPCCPGQECARMPGKDFAVCRRNDCLSLGTNCQDSEKNCCTGLVCIWDQLGRKKACRPVESNLNQCIKLAGNCDLEERHCCPGLKCSNGECLQDCNKDGDNCFVEGEDKCCDNSPCDESTKTCKRKACTEDGQDCTFLQCCPGYICNKERICRYVQPPSSPMRLYDFRFASRKNKLFSRKGN